LSISFVTQGMVQDSSWSELSSHQPFKAPTTPMLLSFPGYCFLVPSAWHRSFGGWPGSLEMRLLMREGMGEATLVGLVSSREEMCVCVCVCVSVCLSVCWEDQESSHCFILFFGRKAFELGHRVARWNFIRQRWKGHSWERDITKKGRRIWGSSMDS
jgi:hypothetical protein